MPLAASISSAWTYGGVHQPQNFRHWDWTPPDVRIHLEFWNLCC